MKNFIQTCSNVLRHALLLPIATFLVMVAGLALGSNLAYTMCLLVLAPALGFSIVGDILLAIALVSVGVMHAPLLGPFACFVLYLYRFKLRMDHLVASCWSCFICCAVFLMQGAGLALGSPSEERDRFARARITLRLDAEKQRTTHKGNSFEMARAEDPAVAMAAAFLATPVAKGQVSASPLQPNAIAAPWHCRQTAYVVGRNTTHKRKKCFEPIHTRLRLSDFHNISRCTYGQQMKQDQQDATR